METEKFYHIYNHANGNENLFKEEENYRFFLQQWDKYISPIAATYAYCLMPNHIHFLVQIRKEEEILNLLNLGGFQNLQGLDRTSKIISKKFSNLFKVGSKNSFFSF
ncbi:MAG: transposase [Vicingaceae bacterium]|nr:transposase [Vicingaceae bacterium]